MRVKSTEVQNNFGKYVKIAAEVEDVIISKNNRDIARMTKCKDEGSIAEEAAVYRVNTLFDMTYDEFMEFTKSTDKRYEFIDGRIFFIAAPGFSHQNVVYELSYTIKTYFRGKKCIPVIAPFEVTLEKFENEKNVVQPDILVICDIDKIDKKGRYHGIPTLVAEVISPSSRENDMYRKRELYILSGVKEYWIVDPEKRSIKIYSAGNGEKPVIRVFEVESSVLASSQVFKGLEVNLADLFSLGQ